MTYPLGVYNDTPLQYLTTSRDPIGGPRTINRGGSHASHRARSSRPPRDADTRRATDAGSAQRDAALPDGLRAGFAVSAVIPIALAADTLSIAVMEIVDNAIMLLVPGAMESGVDSLLFWGALSFALVIAGAVALPVNRWLIARGKGHAVVHETGVHGGLPPRVVAIAAVIAFVFGTSVLAAELFDTAEPAHDSGGHSALIVPA